MQETRGLGLRLGHWDSDSGLGHLGLGLGLGWGGLDSSTDTWHQVISEDTGVILTYKQPCYIFKILLVATC